MKKLFILFVLFLLVLPTISQAMTEKEMHVVIVGYSFGWETIEYYRTKLYEKGVVDLEDYMKTKDRQARNISKLFGSYSIYFMTGYRMAQKDYGAQKKPIVNAKNRAKYLQVLSEAMKQSKK